MKKQIKSRGINNKVIALVAVLSLLLSSLFLTQLKIGDLLKAQVMAEDAPTLVSVTQINDEVFANITLQYNGIAPLVRYYVQVGKTAQGCTAESVQTFQNSSCMMYSYETSASPYTVDPLFNFGGYGEFNVAAFIQNANGYSFASNVITINLVTPTPADAPTLVKANQVANEKNVNLEVQFNGTVPMDAAGYAIRWGEEGSACTSSAVSIFDDPNCSQEFYYMNKDEVSHLILNQSVAAYGNYNFAIFALTAWGNVRSSASNVLNAVVSETDNQNSVPSAPALLSMTQGDDIVASVSYNGTTPITGYVIQYGLRNGTQCNYDRVGYYGHNGCSQEVYNTTVGDPVDIHFIMPAGDYIVAAFAINDNGPSPASSNRVSLNVNSLVPPTPYQYGVYAMGSNNVRVVASMGGITPITGYIVQYGLKSQGCDFVTINTLDYPSCTRFNVNDSSSPINIDIANVPYDQYPLDDFTFGIFATNNFGVSPCTGGINLVEPFQANLVSVSQVDLTTSVNATMQYDGTVPLVMYRVQYGKTENGCTVEAVQQPQNSNCLTQDFYTSSSQYTTESPINVGSYGEYNFAAFVQNNTGLSIFPSNVVTLNVASAEPQVPAAPVLSVSILPGHNWQINWTDTLSPADPQYDSYRLVLRSSYAPTCTLADLEYVNTTKCTTIDFNSSSPQFQSKSFSSGMGWGVTDIAVYAKNAVGFSQYSPLSLIVVPFDKTLPVTNLAIISTTSTDVNVSFSSASDTYMQPWVAIFKVRDSSNPACDLAEAAEQNTTGCKVYNLDLSTGNYNYAIPVGTGKMEIVVFERLKLSPWNDASNVVVYAPCTDVDHDGYSKEGVTCGPIDCNDNDATVNPGATEICDGKDNNCSGKVDEMCPAVYKEDALMSMQTTNISTYSYDTQDKWNKALLDLKQSLGNRTPQGDSRIIWYTSDTIDCNFGHKVFDHEKQAITQLEFVKSVVPGAQQIIDSMVEADRILSKKAIDTMSAGKKKDKAMELYNSAPTERKANQKVQDYRDAWKMANKTCRAIQRSCVDEIFVDKEDGTDTVSAMGDIVNDYTTTFEDANKVRFSVDTSCNKCIRVGDILPNKWKVTKVLERTGMLGTMDQICFHERGL